MNGCPPGLVALYVWTDWHAAHYAAPDPVRVNAARVRASRQAGAKRLTLLRGLLTR